MKNAVLAMLITMSSLLLATNIDPLYDFDYARVGIKGMYLTGGPEFNLDNAYYDDSGKKVEGDGYEYSSMDIWIPIRLGYSFNERFSAGVVVPIASLSHKTILSTGSEEMTQSNTGLGNPWLWGKGCLIGALANNLRLRLGIKLPFGAYTIEDQMIDFYNDPNSDIKLITGDKSLAFDLAVVFTSRNQSSQFRLDGQAAIRYSMEGTYMYDIIDQSASSVTVEEKITPGIWINLRAMPGMAFFSSKSLEAYLWLEYAMQLTHDKKKSTTGGIDNGEMKTSGKSLFTTGIRADVLFDPNNVLELKFLYDVMAVGGKTGPNTFDAMPAGMSFGLGYFGYIPM